MNTEINQRDNLTSKPIFFVAELSANHLGSLARAKELTKAAAEAGATAIKLQTYKPETMTLPLDRFRISSEHKLWGSKNLYDLYQEAMTPWEWHSELFGLARELNVIPFSSPFDRSAVDFLEKIDCPIYKIASMETSDTDLIRYASETKKPLIISTGATKLRELDLAVETALKYGSGNLTLLICTSSYPANPKDSHLNRISFLRRRFGLDVGISDHTLGVGVSIAAITLGACVVEKHLTLKRSEGGHDSAFSMEPNEFAHLVEEGSIALSSLGRQEWSIQESETESRNLRRSLYIVKSVTKGEVASRQNIMPLRPNLGGPISSINAILGKRFKDNFSAGTPATINHVE